MPIIKQQGSILTEQELAFLATQSVQKKNNNVAVYSFQLTLEFDNYSVYPSENLEELILMITASPRGIALILPDHIESEPLLDKLLKLLKIRADIHVFWVGRMPSMDIDLSTFEYCSSLKQLTVNLDRWQLHVAHIFKQWLEMYRVAFIADNPIQKKKHQAAFSEIGLQHVEYFDNKNAQKKINNQQLLIIDLTVNELHLIDILTQLSARNEFPIVLLFGKLPANVCRAAYQLTKNYGFTILASLTCVPDQKQWSQLLESLFSKVYLKHWINEEPVKTGAYGLYNLERQTLNSYFCLFGMSKNQIAALPEKQDSRKIISARSLQDWFPDGIKRDLKNELAAGLNTSLEEIDLCIEYPEKIQTSSVFFASLVMARLSSIRIYWLVHDETQLSIDVLNNFPVSDLILSEKLSHQLLGNPSDELLGFIDQAKKQEVSLCATLQQNQTTKDAMSMYGIEFVLDKQTYIE
ncbi:hypothetical protein [Psychromonas ossibalaenae]|uniref:hypothetical protein n=1 Tax=Psychromonas ossibalaenae TaxID=444922 RepID=UPI00036BCEB3|nr:hypothetical protein [Psychromonas ossibalaenae]